MAHYSPKGDTAVIRAAKRNNAEHWKRFHEGRRERGEHVVGASASRKRRGPGRPRGR